MSLQQREVIITNEVPVPVGLDAPAVAATGTITLGEVANGNTVTIDDGVNTPTPSSLTLASPPPALSW